MAMAFRRRRHHVTVDLELGEARLLDALFADVESMLADEGTASVDTLAEQLGLADPGIGETAERPRDPALARLLPDASRDDPETADEFRRLTERGLRRHKLDGLRAVRHTLTPEAQNPDDDARHARHTDTRDDDARVRVRLDDEQARAWVVAFTDLRLVLAERLGIRTDDDAHAMHARAQELDENDPAAWMTIVFDLVSWLQESLTEVLLADLPVGGDGHRPPPPSVTQ